MASKKNIQEQTKKASVTLAQVSKQSEQVFDTQAKKTTKRSKAPSDYLRLDLKPQGKDLKIYVSRRASEESIRRKEPISTTKYIQELIERDQETNGKRKNTTAEELKNRIDRMSRKQQAVLLDLIDVFGL